MNYEDSYEYNSPNLENSIESVELEPGVTLEHIGMIKPEKYGSIEDSELGAGNPEKDKKNWHLQAEDNSCAVVCQEFVAEQLLHREFSEKDFVKYATEKGWYDPEAGTTPGDVGKILESLGLHVERGVGNNLDVIAEELDTGGKVICGVNNMILARPEMAELPGMNANHAVEVIGVEKNGSDTWVILNDPGVEEGKGIRISEQVFLKAWKTSNNYAMVARRGGV